MITIVVGLQGCGKTRNAEKIAEMLGCTKIIDGGRHLLSELKQISNSSGDDILFLTCKQQIITGHERHIKAVIPYESLNLTGN